MRARGGGSADGRSLLILDSAPPGGKTNKHWEENERQEKTPRRIPFNEMASGLKKRKEKDSR